MSRRARAVFLVALFVASFALRWYVTRDRVSAGHGDVAAYFHVAKNLAAGRGFVQDCIFEYLNRPAGIPAPSNSWWLPLPSIVAASGLALFGDGYSAAKIPMIALSSLIPLLVYAAGWLLLRREAAAIACALLAAGFHLYLDQPNQTLSHGPYALFGGAALLLVIAVRESPRWLPLFGLCFGLTYLTRGDSQVLLPSLAIALLARRFGRERQPIPWMKLAQALALFLLVVAPWWARNLKVFGEPMPSGQKKVAFARNYEDWFTFDVSKLTLAEYEKWGAENIVEQKKDGVLDALEYTPFVFYRSVTREREFHRGDDDFAIGTLGKWAMTPLLFLGLAWLALRRRFAFGILLLHLALLAFVYGVVFPAVGRESYRSGMFSVMPIFLACTVAGASALLEWLRPRARDVALVAVAAALCAANVAIAIPMLRDKYRGTETMLGSYRAFGIWARAQGLQDETFFVRNPWELTVETGMKAATIPVDGPRGLLDCAEKYGVRYVVDEFATMSENLKAKRVAVRALIDGGRLVLLPEQPPMPNFRVYRLRQ